MFTRTSVSILGPVSGFPDCGAHAFGSEEVSILNTGLSSVRSRSGGRRQKGLCVLVVAVCLSLTWPLVAFSQEIDEGEFSRTMLGYKLQLLKSQFEQTEMRLLTQCLAASNAKRLEHVYNEIKRLETEFRCGEYYPDLLDEQIVIIREELRLILADPVKTTSMSEPGFLSFQIGLFQVSHPIPASAVRSGNCKTHSLSNSLGRACGRWDSVSTLEFQMGDVRAEPRILHRSPTKLYSIRAP